jgi:tRNA pseudouridine55 synthase
MALETSGLLNLHKPADVTSRWVVDQVQKLVRPAKVGHAGTLDPLATGVLVVCVGKATRLVEYVQQLPKQYRAEFQLGKTSTTEDITGEVTDLIEPPVPSFDELQTAVRNLTGEILQRPPAFSALKVAGRRAYDLARKGQAVELAPRPVTIHQLNIVVFDYPRLLVDVSCSSGTYIRSLGRDLAEALGTGAVMSALERTAIGNFRVSDSIEVEALTHETLANHLLPPLTAVDHLPRYQLNAAEQTHIANGRYIPAIASQFTKPACEFTEFQPTDPVEYAGIDCRGNLAAILRRRSDELLGPAINFSSPAQQPLADR